MEEETGQMWFVGVTQLLGMCKAARHDFPNSIHNYQASFDLLSTLCARYPQRTDHAERQVTVGLALADAALQAGDWDAALAASQVIRPVADSLAAGSDGRDRHENLRDALQYEGIALEMTGDYPAARSRLSFSLEVADYVNDRWDDNESAQAAANIALLAIGCSLRANAAGDALEIADRALDLLLTPELEPDQRPWLQPLESLLWELKGDALSMQGKRSEAMAAYRHALEIANHGEPHGTLKDRLDQLSRKIGDLAAGQEE